MKKWSIKYQTMRKIGYVTIEANNLAEAIGYVYAKTAKIGKGYGMWKIMAIKELD